MNAAATGNVAGTAGTGSADAEDGARVNKLNIKKAKAQSPSVSISTEKGIPVKRFGEGGSYPGLDNKDLGVGGFDGLDKPSISATGNNENWNGIKNHGTNKCNFSIKAYAGSAVPTEEAQVRRKGGL